MAKDFSFYDVNGFYFISANMNCATDANKRKKQLGAYSYFLVLFFTSDMSFRSKNLQLFQFSILLLLDFKRNRSLVSGFKVFCTKGFEIIIQVTTTFLGLRAQAFLIF